MSALQTMLLTLTKKRIPSRKSNDAEKHSETSRKKKNASFVVTFEPATPRKLAVIGLKCAV